MGEGIGMGNTCKPMAVSFQCMTKSTTNKKKKKKEELTFIVPGLCQALKNNSCEQSSKAGTTVSLVYR